MGKAKSCIGKLNLDGLYVYNGPAPLPHEELLVKYTSVKPEWVYDTLVAQRLTSRDGLIEIGRNYFPVRELIYEKENKSERKRLASESIRDALDSLSPRSEKSCGGTIILKGKVISLVVTLEALILKCKIKCRANPFDRSSVLHTIVADWLNWLFKEFYRIESTYSPEQVRQMLKGYNQYSGQIETPVIAWESKEETDLRNSTKP